MLDIPNPFIKKNIHPDTLNGSHSEKREQENKLNRLLEIRELLTVNSTKKITFSNPMLKQNDNPVIYPRTINVIQGKAGVHKSRLAESVCAALLKKPDYKKDLLGFKADPFNTHTVCYVDTERNLSDQLPYALQQIKTKAGYNIEDTPKNFDYISLLEFKREERFEVLNTYLEHLRQTFDNHIFIILDVITDCIFNFNDTKDSLKLIDLMNTAINHHNVTFLCLIHENPGSTDKARGHLGTEIMNKASTVIQVGFEKDSENAPMDLIKIAYLKCRSSRKHEPFYVQYDDSEKGLVLADEDFVFSTLQSKKQKAGLFELLEHLPEILTVPMERAELIEILTSAFDCKARTIETRLKELIDAGTVIEDSQNNKFNLAKELKGHKIIYSLKPLIANGL